MNPLEQFSQERHHQHYPKIFGPMREGYYPLQGETFTRYFGQTTYNPRWLECAVLVSYPNEERDSWVYVTNGLSNPWDDGEYKATETEYSGMGVEFVIQTKDDEIWPIALLQHMMAYHILVTFGYMGNSVPLHPDDLLALNHPVTFEQSSALTNLLFTSPIHYATDFRLSTGLVDFLHLTGVSNEEYDFGRKTSIPKLTQQLVEAGVYVVTDPERVSII
ncbi:MAG: suppressor of fused domain protein [Bacteroidota bacterium]